MIYDFIYHKIQLTIEQENFPKTNESGEEAQKETTGLIDMFNVFKNLFSN